MMLKDYLVHDGLMSITFLNSSGSDQLLKDMIIASAKDAPFLYGELKDEDKQDRIRFDDICRPSELSFNTIAIKQKFIRIRKECD